MDRIAALTGLAIFAMFFGSGNLMFPLTLGAKFPDSYFSGLWGLLLIESFLPVIGLVALIRFNGMPDLFFDKLNAPIVFLIEKAKNEKTKMILKKLRYLPMLLMMGFILSLVGPFGIVPRSMMVGYGGFKLFGFSSSGFIYFAICFGAVLGLCTWKKDKIMDILSHFLTPLKFGSLLFVIIAGMIFAPSLGKTIFKKEAFSEGVKYGYQMLDLIGAILFARSVVTYMRQKRPRATEGEIFKLSVQASVVSGILLSVIYLLLVFVGAAYSKELLLLEPPEMLPYIAKVALGKNFGLPLVTFVLNISCLATSVILINSFVQFVIDQFVKIKIKLNYEVVLTISLILSVLMASIGFDRLFLFLAGLLDYVYPFLIAYAFYTFFVPGTLNQKNKTIS